MKSLRKVLRILKSKKLIVRPDIKREGNPVNYWMLPEKHSSRSQNVILSKMGELPVRHKRTRYTHFPHECLCSIVQASIEKEYPHFKVFRESTTDFNELPKSLLSNLIRHQGYTPDIVVGVPKIFETDNTNENPFSWIAVEVDRVRRSKLRLLHRLNIYTKHTGFSGLLYFVPDSATLDGLTRIYSSSGTKESLRIRAIQNLFLATALVPSDLFLSNDIVVHCDGTPFSLNEWITHYTKPFGLQKIENLQMIGNVNPPIELIGKNA